MKSWILTRAWPLMSVLYEMMSGEGPCFCMLASSSSAAAIIPVFAHVLSKALNAILSPLPNIRKLHLLSQEKYPTTQFYNFIKHKFTTTCAPEASVSGRALVHLRKKKGKYQTFAQRWIGASLQLLPCNEFVGSGKLV